MFFIKIYHPKYEIIDSINNPYNQKMNRYLISELEKQKESVKLTCHKIDERTFDSSLNS